LNPDGTKNGVPIFWKCAMTGDQYPDTIPLLPDGITMQPGWTAADQAVGVSASYKLYPIDTDAYVLNASATNNKLWQLNVDDSPTSLNRVKGTGAAPGERYLIDAQWGGAKMSSITDGTAVTFMIGEDVGQSEKMLVLGYSNTGTNPNSYIDPLANPAGLIPTLHASTALPGSYASYHWRWANPDVASGQSFKINGAKSGGTVNPNPPGGYSIVDPIDGCAWGNHDCGPNSEIFSFHGPGAHYVFADGHVVFVPEATTKAVLRALATRDQGKVETTPANYGE
jgi:prepilin-type processing-associated H-X9-DG protein